MQAGTYTDWLRRWDDRDSLSALTLAGFESEGMYSVRVEKAGYTPWQVSGVRVRGRRCGKQTLRLDARLVRASLC